MNSYHDLKKRKNETGSGMIEMIMVMALLMLFGFTIYSLIFSGSETLRKIQNDKDAQINARIAVSYINVRCRQSDGLNQISVRSNPLNQTVAIVISFRDPDDVYNNYDTWIYWDEGYLREVLSDADVLPEWMAASNIAPVETFEAGIDSKGTLTGTITYRYQDEIRKMSTVFALRSGGGESL